jgi:MFS family permease
MTGESGASAPVMAKADRRLAILLAMAMFVLVVDTSVMNVSIASVVHDLHTTVSGVQSAIALEALVSAAFILIGSKVGDLIGRKRAYVLGLLGYAIGALAMALAQGLTAVIVFWAIVGGLGASLLLPAMQSLIHGNFEGAAQRQAYALVGAAAAIAAAVGPLLGGFITTYLSWRIAFVLEDVIIAVVLSGIRLVHDVEYTGSRRVDVVGAVLSVLGMGGVVLGILVWQEAVKRSACFWRWGRSRSGCWRGGWSGASGRARRCCWTRTCSRPSCSSSGSPGNCCSRSAWAAR